MGIDFYIKLTAALSAILLFFLKFRSSFGIKNIKEKIKIDFEIAEKVKNYNPELATKIINQIYIKINASYFNINSAAKFSLFYSIWGLIMFIGFAFWSIDLYIKSINFNGWIILTVALSIMGLWGVISGDLFEDTTAMKVDGKELNNPNKIYINRPFLIIHILNRNSFLVGLTSFIFIVLAMATILFVDGISYWLLIPFVFIVISVIFLFSNIKFKSKV